jgi:hypothetical protein
VDGEPEGRVNHGCNTNDSSHGSQHQGEACSSGGTASPSVAKRYHDCRRAHGQAQAAQDGQPHSGYFSLDQLGKD